MEADLRGMPQLDYRDDGVEFFNLSLRHVTSHLPGTETIG